MNSGIVPLIAEHPSTGADIHSCAPRTGGPLETLHVRLHSGRYYFLIGAVIEIKHRVNHNQHDERRLSLVRNPCPA
jgi:hypothetical protein